MELLDLLYSGLIYATRGMLFLWTGVLLAAAFVVLSPSRKSAFLATSHEPQVVSYAKIEGPEIYPSTSELGPQLVAQSRKSALGTAKIASSRTDLINGSWDR